MLDFGRSFLPDIMLLISKGKSCDPELPSFYRRLCMLDTTVKVLRARLATAIQATGDLSPKQYSFLEREVDDLRDSGVVCSGPKSRRPLISLGGATPVSYTHLDVYKRQVIDCSSKPINKLSLRFFSCRSTIVYVPQVL